MRIYRNSPYSSIIMPLANILTIFAYLFGHRHNTSHTNIYFLPHAHTHTHASSVIQKEYIFLENKKNKKKQNKEEREHINREYSIYIFIAYSQKWHKSPHYISVSIKFYYLFPTFTPSGIEMRSIISLSFPLSIFAL